MLKSNKEVDINIVYQVLCEETKNECLVWTEYSYMTSPSTSKKFEQVMLKWLFELTESLKIWIDKGEKLTDGELILAWTNLGSIIECWLKFFFCAYYDEYVKAPIYTTNGGKRIEPENAKFDFLIRSNIGILWESVEDQEYQWIRKIQQYRNAIHAFKKRKLGTPKEFLQSIIKLETFVGHILGFFPPIADYVGYYPGGYVFAPRAKLLQD